MQKATLRAAVLGTVTACVAAIAVTPGLAKSSMPKLTLAVSKNNIKVGGQLVSGAVDVAITVTGESEDNPLLVRLKPHVTAADFIKFVSGLGKETSFDAIDPYGSILFDSADVPSGHTTDAYVDLPAGNYLALNNGNGHTTFTIKQSSSPAALPQPKATLSSIEFGFRGPTTLTDGELVRFRNAGYLIHMFQAAQVASPADATLAEADLLAGNTTAAKKYVVAPLGMFAGPLSSGAQEEETIDAAPGTYVVFCSMNTEDGREHFQLGMYRTITVVK